MNRAILEPFILTRALPFGRKAGVFAEGFQYVSAGCGFGLSKANAPIGCFAALQVVASG
jgi:hypothetical protein